MSTADVSIIPDPAVTEEDDSAEPQWFREIKREDEREHGNYPRLSDRTSENVVIIPD